MKNWNVRTWDIEREVRAWDVEREVNLRRNSFPLDKNSFPSGYEHGGTGDYKNKPDCPSTSSFQDTDRIHDTLNVTGRIHDTSRIFSLQDTNRIFSLQDTNRIFSFQDQNSRNDLSSSNKPQDHCLFTPQDHSLFTLQDLDLQQMEYQESLSSAISLNEILYRPCDLLAPPCILEGGKCNGQDQTDLFSNGCNEGNGASHHNSHHRIPVAMEGTNMKGIHDNDPLAMNSTNLPISYRPKSIRGNGSNREGYCPLCNKWFKLKTSSYWYHMNYKHGVNANGMIFPEPELRDKEYKVEGYCKECKEWISLGVNSRSIKFGWYRHWQKIHSKSKTI